MASNGLVIRLFALAAGAAVSLPCLIALCRPPSFALDHQVARLARSQRRDRQVPPLRSPPRQARPAAPVTARPAAPAGAAAAAGQASATPKAAASQIAAVVNGEQISRTELGRECIRRYGEEVLESLVNRHLIVEACQARGVQITEKDVSDEIDRIAARFGLDRNRWLTLLEQERGFTEAQYKREVVWPMLALRRLAADQVTVTQEELKKAFESEFGPRVRARLIAVDEQAEGRPGPCWPRPIANPASVRRGVEGQQRRGRRRRRASASSRRSASTWAIRTSSGSRSPSSPGRFPRSIQVANMYYILKCEEQIQGQLIASQHLAEQQKRLEEQDSREQAADRRRPDDGAGAKRRPRSRSSSPSAEKSATMPGVAAIVNGKQISLTQLGRRVRHPPRRGSDRRRDQPPDSHAGAGQEEARRSTRPTSMPRWPGPPTLTAFRPGRQARRRAVADERSPRRRERRSICTFATRSGRRSP